MDELVTILELWQQGLISKEDMVDRWFLVISKEKVARVGGEHHSCYVCEDVVSIDQDAYCTKEFEDGVISYRHFWHGVPGITRTVGGGGGINGYAMTLAEAKTRALYYLESNPWAAPEVKAGEMDILREVNRIEELNNA